MKEIKKAKEIVRPICNICGKEIIELTYIHIRTKRKTDLAIHNRCFKNGWIENNN